MNYSSILSPILSLSEPNIPLIESVFKLENTFICFLSEVFQFPFNELVMRIVSEISQGNTVAIVHYGYLQNAIKHWDAGQSPGRQRPETKGGIILEPH